MHVVLRGNIGVQDGVDVFQVVSSGVLVPRVGFGIRTMETSSGSSSESSVLE
jgi:hypothetical protein